MKPDWYTLLGCFGVVGTLIVGTHSAKGDFPDLLKQVPDTANIILLMKSKEIAANASLSANNQINEYLDAAKSWPMVARWEPQRIVIAAEMDIQHMAPDWQMAALELGKAPDLNYLARRTHGVTDNLMDQSGLAGKRCALAYRRKTIDICLASQSTIGNTLAAPDQESKVDCTRPRTWPRRAQAAASGSAKLFWRLTWKTFFDRRKLTRPWRTALCSRKSTPTQAKSWPAFEA